MLVTLFVIVVVLILISSWVEIVFETSKLLLDRKQFPLQ